MAYLTRASLPDRRAPAFEDNMYAQLLMRAVSGSLSAEQSYKFSEALVGSMPDGSYQFEAHCQGQDQDRTTMCQTVIGEKRLGNIYEALRVTWEEKIPGDFVELGGWREGSSIFAAGVIKHLNLDRKVWICDR